MNVPRHSELTLSAYIRDPILRAAFERAEREQGEPTAPVFVRRPNPPTLVGGAAKTLQAKELVDA